MGFLLITLFLWGGYTFLMKRKYSKEFLLSRALILLIFICLISSVCLGINYIASAVPALNDGIGMHNFLAYCIIGEDNWSTKLFKNYFDISIYISLFLTFIYAVLTLSKK
ncbi:MAG: hypothetical protein WCQ54_12395 [Clostridiaceae bacterium]